MADELISLKQFLEGVPPAIWRGLEKPFIARSWQGGSTTLDAELPQLMLDCNERGCGGEMTFDPSERTVRVSGSGFADHTVQSDHFLRCTCRHCRRTTKTFAVRLLAVPEKNPSALKLGEWPPFGPKMPRVLLEMFASDKDLLLNGRRSENQGLGIGALAYYRRVIENEKNTLFDAIIAAAQKIPGSEPLIADLSEAKKTRSFAESAEAIKAVWPQQLLVNGESPLDLLHGALSAGLHALDDAECQQIATNMRTVLSAFAQQIVDLRRDDEELSKAARALAELRRAGKTK